MFVIQFKAFDTYPFLQLPMDEMSDRIVPSDQLSSHHLFNMRQVLIKPRTREKRLPIVY
jgi:hypothetical protein